MITTTPLPSAVAIFRVMRETADGCRCVCTISSKDIGADSAFNEAVTIKERMQRCNRATGRTYYIKAGA